MLDQRRPDDLVVVTKFDRRARSLEHLIDIVETTRAREAAFRSLAEATDTTMPAG